MTLSRPLRFYERINAGSNVNFMLEFEAEKLTKEHLIEAFKLVKTRHPYYQMSIKTNADGSAEFVHNPDLDADINVEHFQLNELDDWQQRLVKMASDASNESSLVRLELYSLSGGRLHQLFGCVNHAGIDGPGLFRTIRDLVSYLDVVLSNGNRPDVQPRKFLDVHGNYEHSFDMEALKNEPVVTEFIESVKAIGQNSKEQRAFIDAKFFQADELFTKNLLAECKKNQVTIQSILSTAAMITHLNEKKSTSGKFFNSCPCCMRPFVAGLSGDDMLCGSAALIWDYDVDLNESFWSVTQKTKEGIKKCLTDQYGLKWWIKLANSIPTQGYSIMSSSMGVVSLNESELKSIKVKDLRFLGSSYNLPAACTGIMTHAFTFMGRFTLDLSYTFPNLTSEWAHVYSSNMWKVLELAAQGKLNDSSLKQVIDLLNK